MMSTRKSKSEVFARFDERRATAATMYRGGSSYKEIGAALGIQPQQAKRLVDSQIKRDEAREQRAISVQLSFRAIRSMNYHLGLGMWDRPSPKEMADVLSQMTFSQFCATPSTGLITTNEVKSWLEARGLTFMPE